MVSRILTAFAAAAGLTLGLAGCGDDKRGARESNSRGSINVAIVNNPNQEDLARLTPSCSGTARLARSWTVSR